MKRNANYLVNLVLFYIMLASQISHTKIGVGAIHPELGLRILNSLMRSRVVFEFTNFEHSTVNIFDDL